MTIMCKYFRFVSCLMVLFLIAGNSAAINIIRESFDGKSQEAITKGVLNQQVRIVPQVNKLNFGLGRFNGINYHFQKSLSKIFFLDRTIAVNVTAIEFDDMKISMTLFHPVLGDGSIKFVFDEEFLSRITDENLQKILLTTLGDENNKYVFGDPDSKTYHLYTCLHTKDERQLLRMTQADAEQQGFSQCGFCFKKVVYLPDLAVEKEIKREWSARIREYEPLMDGSEQQIYLSNLGKELLQNWPFQLLGYDYSFHLIKSDRMNAIAMPTGKIVITTALLEALENEKEIEALLLLAIAHVEKRHSLKQHQLKMDNLKSSDSMKTFVKAAGSVFGLFPGGSLIGTLGSLPFQKSHGTPTSVLEFEADFEKEADALAALYFDLNHEDKSNLSTLIKKMQLAKLSEQSNPGFGDGLKDFYFNDRIKRVENTKFLYFEDEKSYVLNRKNKLPVQLDLLYQSIIAEENNLIVYISDKFLLPGLTDFDNGKAISLIVQDQNGEKEFNLEKRFTTEDLWGAQLTLQVLGKKNQQLIRDIGSVKLVLTTHDKPGDKRGDPVVENFIFAKGELVY